MSLFVPTAPHQRGWATISTAGFSARPALAGWSRCAGPWVASDVSAGRTSVCAWPTLAVVACGPSSHAAILRTELIGSASTPF